MSFFRRFMLSAAQKPAKVIQDYKLSVKRFTSDTYVSSTTYTADSFIGFSVTAGSNGCHVLYAGIEKDIPANTSQDIIFGKYKGVDDGTAESGIITFSGDYKEVAPLSFSSAKSTTKRCDCIVSIVQWFSNTFIGKYAFAEQSNIVDITIPDYIYNLPDYMFYKCINLINVNMHDKITKIGSYVFSNCTSLPSITIPEGITKLSYTFQYCTSLQSFTIPNGVKILNATFYGCSNIKQMHIPANVKKMEKTFYNCKGLTSVTFDSGVKSFKYAFYGCTGLTSITIPDSVKSIYYDLESGKNSLRRNESSEFQGCTSLTNIYVNANNPYFSADNGILYDKNKTKLYTVPRGKLLTSFTVPSTVETIYNNAFIGQTSLTSLNLNNTKTVGANAFEGCTSLETLSLSNVENVYSEAFFDCSSVTSLTIPASLKHIGTYSFVGFVNCSSLVFNANIESYPTGAKDYNPFAGMGQNASSCSLSFNNTINVLTPYMFKQETLEFAGGKSYTSKFTNVNLNNVIEIGDENFMQWENNGTFNFGNTLQVIGTEAFYSFNYHLKDNFILPASLKTIKDYAFYGVLNVGSNSTSTITFKSTTPPVLDLEGSTTSHHFSDEYKVGGGSKYIAVPSGSLTAYKNDPVWSLYNLEGV